MLQETVDVILYEPKGSVLILWIVDGTDEGNLIIPYSQEAEKEVRRLMFAEWNMASTASSSLIMGYHQDISLGAYLLSLDGTFLDQDTWIIFSRIVWEHSSRGKIVDLPYDAWVTNHINRCIDVGVDPLSGKSLYSLLLPQDMEWRYSDARITRGILVSGVLTEKVCSSSPSSIGMNLYRTYGSTYTMSWLNSSYQLLGRYVRWRGITLGFPDLQIDHIKQKEVDTIIYNGLRSTPSSISGDSSLSNRRELDIIEHLGNIRDTVAIAILGEKDPKNKDVDTLLLYVDHDTLSKRRVSIRMPTDIDFANVDEVVLEGGKVTINTHQGWISYVRGGSTYRWSMSIFPRVRLNGIEYTHKLRPLKAMIDSGARGNSISATQIAGTVGSLTYAGGRIPLMIQPGSRPDGTGSRGKRSMPVLKFGTDTPESRGFIAPSYLQGVSPSDYMMSHVASRENLSANTSLTPQTGYFGRSLRVFLENLQIDYVDGRQAVVNERGVVVSVNYLLDPGKTFAIDNKYTFVDTRYELRKIRNRERSTRCIYISIPYTTDYLPYDDWLHTLKNVDDRDIIIHIDPRSDQEYVDFLRDILPHEIGKRVTVLRSSITPISFDEYREIIVLPPYTPITEQLLSSTLDEGMSAKIGYRMRQVPSIRDLYPLILGIVDVRSLPIIVRPDRRYRDLIKTHSLVESLLLMGSISPI